jgi:nucleoside-diphosphate-sugar epimerase
MTKIAVTGSGGVVGRALCEDLARDNDVVTVDLRDADFNVDVRDLSALENAFADCDAVVHLAGASSVLSSWKDVHETNIGGTYNAFEAARRAGVKQMIFASSNHAVGQHEVEGGRAIYETGAGIVLRGIDEQFRADSLYGVSKAFGEVLGRYYSEAFGMRVACVRIGSIVEGDSPIDPSLGVPPFLPKLKPDDARARYAATWMSKRDFARLVRAILSHDVPYAVVYGVGDNLTRFWDLEPGRTHFGFWPLDGTRTMQSSPI